MWWRLYSDDTLLQWIFLHHSTNTTVMGSLVYLLCRLSSPVISDHNTQRWGYFDMEICQWQLNVWVLTHPDSEPDCTSCISLYVSVQKMLGSLWDCCQKMLRCAARCDNPITGVSRCVFNCCILSIPHSSQISWPYSLRLQVPDCPHEDRQSHRECYQRVSTINEFWMYE